MSHSRFDKPLLRLAVRIRASVETKFTRSNQIHLPDDDWRACQSLVTRISLARQHGLTLAEKRLRQDLRTRVSYLQRGIELVSGQLQLTSETNRFASVAEIYSDLSALGSEFEDVTWDDGARTISATTESIVFDWVDLGRFEIRLYWEQLGSSQPYEAIALEPNPASQNESVTHPHVQDNAVCEGDGRYAIERALQQGRLLDFFLLVRSILTTYNSSSPYVSLQRWSGLACPSCDDVFHEDSLSGCCQCEGQFCDGCSSVCTACGNSCCFGCSSHCSMCEETVCAGCETRCQDCKTLLCSVCAIEERCNSCHEQTQIESSDEPGECSNPAVQPMGLVETVVSA